MRKQALSIGGVLLGLGLGCGGPPKADIQLTTGALTRLSDYERLTGTTTYAIDEYVYSADMFFRTNYLLDDALDPVSGIGPNGPSILGSSLGGVRVDGQALAGRAVIGSELDSVDATGAVQRVRIDDVRRSETGDRDLLLYDASVLHDGAWGPLCSGRPAIALPGAWDLTEGTQGDGGWRDHAGFFFACQGSTVAKCYELGFKPWKFQQQGELVLNLHEACVRALRADYGGTGETGTSDGVEVVLSTERNAEVPPGFELEAAWSVDGARCRLSERVSGLSANYHQVPACDEAMLGDAGNLLYTFTRGAAPDPDLRFALRCDEGGGGTAIDSVGARVATLSGGAGWSTETADGSPHACAFGGGHGRASVESFSLSGAALTMSAWVKVDSFAEGDDPRVLSKTTGGHPDDHFWMMGFKRGRVRVRLATDGVTELVGERQIDLGVWHHLAATYDGSHLRIYVDGVLDASVGQTGALAEGVADLGIGNQPTGAGDRPLDGLVDDVRLYSRALTAAEIANEAHRADGAAVTPSPDPAEGQARRAVLVHDDPLRSEDAVIVDRLEALGFTVTTVDDDAVVGGDFAGAAVVVVAESVVSGDLDSSVWTTAVPMVNLERNSADEQGLCDGGGSAPSWTTETQFPSVGHPITEGYSGTRRLTEGTSDIGVIRNLAPGAVSLAYELGDPGDSMMVALEAGHPLNDGNPAVNRQVYFGVKEMDEATETTRLLFDRAVRWAAGEL